MKNYLLLVLFFVSSIVAKADVVVKTQAPSTVICNEEFRLQYVVNTQDVSNFKIPTIKGIDVLIGPSISSSSSYQFVNGRQSSTSSITYTYILSASRPGSYTIPGASVVVNGKTYTSRTVKITALPGDKKSPLSPNNSSRQSLDDDDFSNRPVSRISGKDLFITVTANKTKVFEQEPILLTYKVYTRLNLTQLAGKMPDLKGFLIQEVPLPQQKSFSIENHNGQNYKTTVWSQYVMFPQQTGKLVIPSINFEGIVVQPNPNVDPFEAFLNGNSNFSEVKKIIKTPSLTIDVAALKNKPSNFSGGVGNMNISASLTTANVKSNEAMNIRVVISGMGNLKLIKTPKIDFPIDFETYDAKVTDRTKLTNGGLAGNMIYDYLAIPKKTGKFTIPPIVFVFFDASSNSYKTLRTQPIEVNVAKGSSSASVDEEELKLLNSDIRYIKLGTENLRQRGDSFWGTSVYAILYAVIGLFFIGLMYVLRRQMAENADLRKRKGKAASRVARNRMKKAEQLMKDKKSGDFYEEVSRALFGYASDKFGIPLADLNKDTILQILREHQVNEEVSLQFVTMINDCEFARFAPSAPNGSMEQMLTESMKVMTIMENSIKKVKK